MSNAPIEPKNVRVLLVDSKGSSRQEISSLLRDCSYQVTINKAGAGHVSKPWTTVPI
jgi:CheY-like chemotaxis protein